MTGQSGWRGNWRLGVGGLLTLGVGLGLVGIHSVTTQAAQWFPKSSTATSIADVTALRQLDGILATHETIFHTLDAVEEELRVIRLRVSEPPPPPPSE